MRMTQPAKSQEPSMEEILASIRRIIADDDATKSAQRPPEPPKAELPPPPSSYAAPAMPPLARIEPEIHAAANSAAAAGDDDQSSEILDLNETMATAPPPPAPSAMPEPNPQFRTIDGSSDVGFDEDERPAAPAAMPPREERGRLISSETSAAVDSAFSALAQTVLVQNARTLEDLVREMLRPMLKTWLDDNLPGLVERLVRAEIERVSRGRMS
jgi:cell pole-organizing protein PopZ